MSSARTARKPRRPRTLPNTFPSEIATLGGFWLSCVRRDFIQLDALREAMDKAVHDEILWFAMLQGRHALDAQINDAFEIIQRIGDLLRVLPTRRGAA